MTAPRPDPSSAAPAALHGLLAEFKSPGALISAAEQIRDAGYTRWDTHSPFPIHGIDEAMGIRPTLLPWIVFAAGVIGCLLGLLLQWWTNATGAIDAPWAPTFLQGYDFIVSGKPTFSLPANIPVIFETTVLLAALAAVIGMLAMNNLPRHHHALFAQPRFLRATADRFFVVIEARDPRFDPHRTRSLLEALEPAAIERVVEPPSSRTLPRALTIGTIIVITLLLLPPLVVARARVSKSTQPRIHPIQDMDNQERFKAQQAHPLFADGRAARPPIHGTVARGELRDDPPYYQGRTGPDTWLAGYPDQVTVTTAFVQRGQQRFNIYCAPCHGLGGAGDGIVSQRALELDTPNWVQPTSLLDPLVIGRPHGHLFNTISVGIRSMPAYGDQIPPPDRWAIVAYIRALQRSQNARIEDVPRELRPELR